VLLFLVLFFLFNKNLSFLLFIILGSYKLVRPAGYKKTEREEEKMEKRMAAIEKFISE